MTRPIDLFGNPTGPDQLSMFGDGADRLETPVQRLTPDPEVIRRRLNALLDCARQAHSMPWSARDARMWQTVFPNMANWLPVEEAEQLRFAFAVEMRRLSEAAGRRPRPLLPHHVPRPQIPLALALLQPAAAARGERAHVAHLGVGGEGAGPARRLVGALGGEVEAVPLEGTQHEAELRSLYASWDD